MDPETVDLRKKQLQEFLNECATQEKVRTADSFLKFVGLKEGYVGESGATSPPTSPTTSPIKQRQAEATPTISSTTTITTSTSSSSTSSTLVISQANSDANAKAEAEMKKELEDLLVEFGYGVLKNSELGPVLDSSLRAAHDIVAPSSLVLPIPSHPPDLVEALKKWAQTLLKHKKGDMVAGIQAAFLLTTAFAAVEHGHPGNASSFNSELTSAVRESFEAALELSTTEKGRVQIFYDTLNRQREVVKNLRKEVTKRLETQSGEDVHECCKLITNTFKQLVEQMLNNHGGKAPCSWFVIAGGSMGREEMSPFSDLEFAIVIEDEAHAQWFKVLNFVLELQVMSLGETAFIGDQRFPGATAGVSPKLWALMFPSLRGPIQNGFRFDEGTTSPSASPAELISSPQRLVNNLAKSTEGQGDNIVKTSLLHHTFVAGDKALFQTFSEMLQKELAEGGKLKKRAVMVMEEFIQNFTGDRFESEKKYHIKNEFYRIFHGIIGNLAMLNDIHSTNGWEQLAALKEKGVFSEETYHKLVHTLNTIVKLRMQTQLFYGEECEVIHFPAEKQTEEGEEEVPQQTKSHEGKLTVSEAIANELEQVYAVNFALVDAAQQMLSKRTDNNFDFSAFQSLKFDSLEGVGMTRLRMGKYKDAVQTFKTILKSLLEEEAAAVEGESVSFKKIQSKRARNLLGVSLLHLAKSISVNRKQIEEAHKDQEKPSNVKQRLWRMGNELEENLEEARKFFESLLEEDRSDYGEQSFEVLTDLQHLSGIAKEKGDVSGSLKHISPAIDTAKGLIVKVQSQSDQPISHLYYTLAVLLNEKADLLIQLAQSEEEKLPKEAQEAEREAVRAHYRESVALATESLEKAKSSDRNPIDLQIDNHHKLILAFEKAGDKEKSREWKKKLIQLEDQMYGRNSSVFNDYLKVMMIEIAKETGTVVLGMIVDYFIAVAKKMVQDEINRQLEIQKEEARREVARREYEAKKEAERQAEEAKQKAADAIGNLNPLKNFFK